MLNYSIESAPRSKIDLDAVLPVLTPQDKDGVIVLMPVFDRYKGMKAQSFSISSQLEAGVSLSPSPFLDFSDINTGDRLNREARSIIDNFKTE